MKNPTKSRAPREPSASLALLQSRLALIVSLLLFTAGIAFAGSATWKANLSSNNWNDPANWTPATVPNGPNDTATFQSSNQTNVSLSAHTEVNGIVFNTGASAFTVTANPGVALTISGAGIANNSGIQQTVEAAADQNNVAGGSVIFRNNAAAGNVTLAAPDPKASVDTPGTIQFLDTSHGAQANVVVSGYGALDISAHDAPGMRVELIAGNGRVLVGTNNLTVGGNDVSTTFSGFIMDDFHGGTVGKGSFTKIGKGTLTMSGEIICYGGTTLKGGKLLLDRGKRGIGIDGPVQVIRGTLGGIGAIFAYGDVVIGTGSSVGAELSPGKTPMRAGYMQISNGNLTFNSLSTYRCALQRNRGTVSYVFVTNGVTTINDDVSFTFVDSGTGTLIPGTIFTAIQSSAPITGTFSNLPEGATFTSNGTTFKASYIGGEGNDLTLTVQ